MKFALFKNHILKKPDEPFYVLQQIESINGKPGMMTLKIHSVSFQKINAKWKREWPNSVVAEQLQIWLDYILFENQYRANLSQVGHFSDLGTSNTRKNFNSHTGWIILEAEVHMGNLAIGSTESRRKNMAWCKSVFKEIFHFPLFVQLNQNQIILIQLKKCRPGELVWGLNNSICSHRR